MVGRLIGRSVVPLVVLLVGRFVGRLFRPSFSLSVVQSVRPSFHLSVVPSVGRSIGWSFLCSVSWLFRHLVGRLFRRSACVIAISSKTNSRVFFIVVIYSQLGITLKNASDI